MKKILSLLFSVMLVASIISVPAMADGTESEFTPEFIGIGSARVAYDDLTLPQTTANGDEITWSTTTTDVIEIVDNTTAKIKKYVEDAQLDANVVATVNGTPNTIAFKVGFVMGEKTEKYTDDFDTATSVSSEYSFRKSTSTDNLSIDNKSLKINRPTAATDNFDFILTPASSGYSTGTHAYEFDFRYQSSLGQVIVRMPADSYKASPAEIKFSNNGSATIYSESKADTTFALDSIATDGNVVTYGCKLKIVLDRDNSAFRVLVNDNLIDKTYKFQNGFIYSTKGVIRIYVESNTGTGSMWLDNVSIWSHIIPFAGLEQSTINPVEDATIASSLTLPATNTATYPVTWTSADSSFAIDGATATGNASYFGTKAGSLTAKATNDGVEYVKNYSFTIPAAEFPATTTAVVTGDKAAGGTLTATISGLTSTSDILTAIIGVYNGNELVTIKLAPQAVTDGKLTVTTNALGSDVSAESDVKVFVLDSANTANPLTKVTVQ